MSGRPERGSALLLYPTGVLVVLVLAAITVDLAAAFLAQRELARAIAGAASDAATEGVGNRAFYRENRIELEDATVEQAIADHVTLTLDPARYQDLEVRVEVARPGGGCPPVLWVRASAQVDYVFAKAIPGAPRRAAVRATSAASPWQGPVACPTGEG